MDKSPYFTNVSSETTCNKRQKNLTEKERKITWEFHYGAHAKEGVCIMCDVNRLVKNDVGSFQVGHIVARNYLEDPGLLSNPIYLLPCCNACNLETTTNCIFNVLWERGKGMAIKQISERVYNYYAQMNPQHLTFYDKMMWKLIRGLYGSERHKLGGGIHVANEEPLYRMLMLYQMQLLEAEIAEHLGKIKQRTVIMERLLDETNRPSHGGPKNKSIWV